MAAGCQCETWFALSSTSTRTGPTCASMFKHSLWLLLRHVTTARLIKQVANASLKRRLTFAIVRIQTAELTASSLLVASLPLLINHQVETHANDWTCKDQMLSRSCLVKYLIIQRNPPRRADSDKKNVLP